MNNPDDIQQIDDRLKELENELKPLRDEMENLQTRRSTLVARRFIEANGITREDIEMSSGDGKPYFWHVSEFIKWMRSNNVSKNWAEWNTGIYRMSDLLNNRMPDPAAYLRDIKH